VTLRMSGMGHFLPWGEAALTTSGVNGQCATTLDI
jgi:hypothetical protein